MALAASSDSCAGPALLRSSVAVGKNTEQIECVNQLVVWIGGSSRIHEGDGNDWSGTEMMYEVAALMQPRLKL